jgi:hypothetical protein
MIKTLVHIFIAWKTYQLIVAITLVTIAYNMFPQPFQFIFQILHNIK